MAGPVPGEPLARLAESYGVATEYRPSPDRTVAVPAEAVAAALAALGVDTTDPEAALAARERELAERLLPPTVVLRPGRAPELPEGADVRVATEDGESRTGPAALEDLPYGVHRLAVTAPDGRTGEAHLIVAPDRAPGVEGRHRGLLVQLYSLLSHRSWGMGDLGDLADLAAWAGRALDVGFVQLNPLHASVPGPPVDPSPYR
ncbi:4-alpha-glucanotransferase, partial [Streptomyces sp. CO7]